MIVEPLKKNGIPLLTCHNGEKVHSKLVVVYHGAFMKKELLLKYEYVQKLVKRGCFLVIPELPMHGERRDGEIYEPERDRLSVAFKAGSEITTLLDEFANKTSSCSCIGGSLGGLCALAAALSDARISAVACYGTYLSWSLFKKEEEFYHELLDFDVLYRPEILANRRLLYMVGEKDKWARPEIAEKCIEKVRVLAPEYGGKVSYHEISGCKHELVKEMEDMIEGWILGAKNLNA